jgi:CHASE2 domain
MSKNLVVGLTAAAILVVTKIVLEFTPVGPWAEKQAHALLFAQLPRFREDGPAVTLIDIGHLPGGTKSGRAPLPTSRAHLRALVEALAAEQPLAIGIDIDFSPNRSGWIEKSDPGFFEYCLELNKRIPVRLGIFRSMREPKDAWLGVPRYAALAGALWLPGNESRRLPISFQADPGSPPVPSMGAALAQAVAKDKDLLAHPLSFLLEKVTTREVATELHAPPLLLREVMVNYALLHQTEDRALREASPADIAKYANRIRNRVVIIGDLSAGSRTDIFPVPGIERDQRGALLHAALAHTLLDDPIAEFKHSVRLVLDVLLALAVVLFVNFTKQQTGREGWVIAGTVAVVLTLGFAFVVWFRVMWLDFLLVVVFLLLHPAAHRWFTKVVSRLKFGKKAEDPAT